MNDKTLKKISIVSVILAVIISAGGCIYANTAAEDGIKVDSLAGLTGAYEADEEKEPVTETGSKENANKLKEINLKENANKSNEIDLTGNVNKTAQSESKNNNDSIISRKNTDDLNNQAEESVRDERNGSITKEYHFSVGSMDDVNIPPEISADGKTYELAGAVKYKDIKEIRAVKQIVKTEVVQKSDLDRSVSFKSDVTGITYSLRAKEDAVFWGSPTAITKKVTETVEWGPCMERPSIPGKKAITYHNPVTGQNESVSGTLTGTRVSEPFWSKAEEPISGIFARSEGGVTAYTTDYILPDGTSFAVPLDMENSLHPSWNGYEKDILKIMKLDDSLYRIIGAGWAGETYFGVECEKSSGMNVAVAYRNAIYPYEALCRTYKADYAADVQTEGYKTEVTYYAPYEELLNHYSEEEILPDLSTVYDVTVKATYKAIP